MNDQLIKKFKVAGYTLDSSDIVTKCACVAERHGFTAGEFAEEFEGFAISR